MTGLDMALNVDTAMTTVFVPINAAFEAAAAQKNMTLNALFSDTNALTMVSNPMQPTLFSRVFDLLLEYDALSIWLQFLLPTGFRHRSSRFEEILCDLCSC